MLGWQHRCHVIKILDERTTLTHVRDSWGVDHPKSETELLHSYHVKSGPCGWRLGQDIILLAIVHFRTVFVLILLVEKGVDEA